MSNGTSGPYGIRKGEKNIEIQIRWTDGKTESFDITEINREIK